MSLLDRLSDLAENADDLLRRARTRLGLLHPVQIMTYRSYGTAGRLYVKGRVLTDKGIGEPDPTDSRWHNLLNMYRRFDSNPRTSFTPVRQCRRAIRHALARASGNISGTARLLGVSRPTLYDLMKAYDLQP